MVMPVPQLVEEIAVVPVDPTDPAMPLLQVMAEATAKTGR
jgi:hypothetical protein